MTIASQHLQFARLVELAEKSQTPSPTDETHLAACGTCAAEFSRLSGVINLMRTDEAEDAPHNAIAHAINLFHVRVAGASRARREEKSVVRRILAALSFDSFATPAPAFGIRSGQAAARQLLYSGDEHELDVRVSQVTGGEAFVVSGQVLGECLGGGAVRLETAAGETIASSDLNDMCEFLLPPVEAGEYTLRVRTGDVELEVVDFHLKP